MAWTSFLKWFWNSDVWLPPGFDWEDMKNNANNVQYPKFGDLVYPIPLSLVLLLVRVLTERAFLFPLGRYLGIKARPRRKVENIPVLENAYKSRGAKKLTHKELEGIAKQTDLRVRQVERWLRRRSNLDKATTLSKFSESGWKFVCYTNSMIIGIYVLWDKAWFWDINYCWYDFPQHSMTSDVWWYYMLGSCFYWSLMFSQFFDAHRKDFWQMFVHHLTTICLLGFSWTCNFTRIGTLVLLLHDSADVVLELAKMSKYAEMEKTCDVLFGVFTIVWVITRLGIFPAYVLNSTLLEAPKLVPMFSAYYIFNSMLSMLLVLHLFWTYFIFKVIFKAISTGKLDKDERSSSDETVSDSSSSTVETTTNNHIVGPHGDNKDGGYKNHVKVQ